ncbi:MAG: glycosyltransferase family 4 protein [Firmicutes bacterium]|nr:glycosyltransferase family 4 protein [Bacillota bacterium]
MSALTAHGPMQGERLRLENLIRGSMAQGDVDLWHPRKNTNPLTRATKAVHSRSPYMLRHSYLHLGRPSGSYDVVIAFQLRMAPYAIMCPGAVHILDLTDSLGLFRHRLKKFHTGLVRRMLLWNIEEVELYWARRFTETWVSGWQDQKWLTDRKIDAKVVANAVHQKDLLPPGNPHELLFVANLAYLPNRLGLEGFLRTVWPSLRDEGYVLHVAGAGTQSVHADGVVAHGFVEDLRSLYLRTGISISPVELGTGTQNKILEALGYGRPVITGPNAYQTLPQNIQAGAACAATWQEWLRELRLLQDPALYVIRAQAGFNAVEENGEPVSRRLRQLRG